MSNTQEPLPPSPWRPLHPWENGAENSSSVTPVWVWAAEQKQNRSMSNTQEPLPPSPWRPLHPWENGAEVPCGDLAEFDWTCVDLMRPQPSAGRSRRLQFTEEHFRTISVSSET
ncbi:hypothetical protein MHYP_G00285270 [Metynnis hypsauchen]